MNSATEAQRTRHSAARLIQMYHTTVGKKIVMAVTGIILLIFVIGHMVGNLKIYLGQEHYDAYGLFLRRMGEPLLMHGQALWMARAVLLAALVIHVTAAVQLTLLSWEARPDRYRNQERLAFSYASYTMRWGGLTILAFVIYHLM